ncbi:MAG: hypothetical protein ACLFNQ_06555 [Spirochaetaceae bacterium]
MRRKWFVPVVALVVLVGCIDYEDEMIISADRSAEHRVAVAVSREFSEMDDAPEGMGADARGDLFEGFAGEGITVLSQESYEESKTNVYGQEEIYDVEEITVRYDDVAQASNLDADGNSFTFEQRSDGSYVMRRRLEMEGAGDRGSEMDEMMELMRVLFAGNGFSFAVEMPGDVRIARVEGAPDHLQPTWQGSRVEWYLPFVEMMGAKEDFWLVVETAAR